MYIFTEQNCKNIIFYISYFLIWFELMKSKSFAVRFKNLNSQSLSRNVCSQNLRDLPFILEALCIKPPPINYPT